jgi:hypothetical protein
MSCLHNRLCMDKLTHEFFESQPVQQSVAMAGGDSLRLAAYNLAVYSSPCRSIIE